MGNIRGREVLTICIPGNPVGKGRPRMTRRGHAYTPKLTADHERNICAVFASKYPGHEPLDGPLEMVVLAYFQIPKSASRKAQEDMATGVIRPTKKPDADNLLKLCADALTGRAYRDDSQLVVAAVEKWYSRTPHVEIKVMLLGEDI